MQKQTNNQVHALTKNNTDIANCIITSVEITNVASNSTISSQGIWDTGATSSVVTKSAASVLGLIPIGKAKVRGVHGVRDVNEYFVRITLDNKNITLQTSVTECDELSNDNSVGMLLGMNIITLGDFAITNYQGNTTMSFRVPSLQKIDFVKQQ
ncbi:hypothetical protein AGMMS49965_21290 [Bacteroidia bacterium]|nr:hypothetical protein AGMMS49965_21290 [Bacteroidia bacterium]